MKLVQVGLAAVFMLALVTGCVIAFIRTRGRVHEREQAALDDAFDRGRFQEANRRAMEEERRMVPRRGA